MKKQLILGSFLALAITGYSQIYTPSGVIQGSSTNNNVGIGVTPPSYKLDVQLGSQYDGVNINGNGATGNAGLFLKNSTNSTEWQLWNLGSTNAWGSGNFCIYDGSSSQPQIFVHRTRGHVGFGTNTPDLTNDYARVFANEDVTPLGQGIWYYGVKGHVQSIAAIPGSGAVHTMLGVEGQATGYNNEAFTFGVRGKATSGYENVGGAFEATGNGTGYNVGVYGTASGNSTPSKNWACRFDGATYCTSGAWTSSDRKLKKDIKPLNNVIEKIKLLKPSIYSYRADEELKALQLPQEKQMGLIAQELEEVFPELVREISPLTKLDANGQKSIVAPGFKTVQYGSLIPVLIAGIQEQQTQIESQQKQLDAQKALIDQLLSSKSAMPTGINEIEGASGFKMEQNIPNPFSSETVIKYTLAEQTKTASLMVYDLSGKQVASFSIDKAASSITVSSDKLAAGIYIYSIIADGKILDSKRMVIANK